VEKKVRASSGKRKINVHMWACGTPGGMGAGGWARWGRGYDFRVSGSDNRHPIMVATKGDIFRGDREIEETSSKGKEDFMVQMRTVRLN